MKWKIWFGACKNRSLHSIVWRIGDKFSKFIFWGKRSKKSVRLDILISHQRVNSVWFQRKYRKLKESETENLIFFTEGKNAPQPNQTVVLTSVEWRFLSEIHSQHHALFELKWKCFFTFMLSWLIEFNLCMSSNGRFRFRLGKLHSFLAVWFTPMSSW